MKPYDIHFTYTLAVLRLLKRVLWRVNKQNLCAFFGALVLRASIPARFLLLNFNKHRSRAFFGAGAVRPADARCDSQGGLTS